MPVFIYTYGQATDRVSKPGKSFVIEFIILHKNVT